MDYRKYYVNLNPEDFKFVTPVTKASLNNSKEEGNISDEKQKESKEEKDEETEEEYDDEECDDEEYEDYNKDDSEVQSEKKDKEACKPSASEIDEWRQAVAALSSRAVKFIGRLFGDLEPVPFIDTLDPAPGSCFNCWQVGHPSKLCRKPRTVFCINCGRRDEVVVTCPRCSRQQRDFFIKRRIEERRRAASTGRERASERLVRAGRSTSVGIRAINDRKVMKAAGATEGSAGVRAARQANNGARYKREAVSKDSREYPQREARTEKLKVAHFSDLVDGLPRREMGAAIHGGPNDYRGSCGGKEAGEVVASSRTWLEVDTFRKKIVVSKRPSERLRRQSQEQERWENPPCQPERGRRERKGKEERGDEAD